MTSLDANLLQLTLWLPAVGAILALVLGQGQRARGIAVVITGFTLLLSIWLFVRYDLTTGGIQFASAVPFIPQIGSSISIGADGVSMPLVFLNAFLTFLVVLMSWNFELRPQLYFTLVMLLETAVMGVFVSLDLLVFFLFWELELAPMYLLIGIWGGPRREYAAMKFIIYTIIGSAFMLVGILALVFSTSAPGAATFDLMQVSAAARTLAPASQVLMFVLLYVGFAVKVPIFPFHTWLPDAHVEAPTPISVLLAGVLLKMGGYGLIRLCVTILPEGARVLVPFLVVLGVINVIYGALVALAQINGDLKKMIANSSISHMGYVILGLAALSATGIQGAVMQMFTHGTITALLFTMVGLVYDRTHTRIIPEMGGLAQRMPFVATAFVMAGLASLGLPGLNGFIGEFIVFMGAFQVWPIYTAISVFAIVLTAGYLTWMLLRIFFGPMSGRWHHLTDASAREKFVVVALLFVIILTGVYPSSVADMIAVGVAPIARLFA
ncbi:MAG: NADH-quinone oxidoreductase subunit M [Chloroflexi bacterium]|nr:NADH-quinone oxidoreductase subunit M [Chloroflexota bacterium]